MKYSAIDRERMIAVHEVNQFLLQGLSGKAVEVFFTSSALQSKRADVVVEVLNKMLDTAAEGRGNKAAALAFLNAVTRDSVSLIDDAEFSRAVQLMAGQALTIILWMDARIPGANNMRLTADQASMAFNDKYGRSFVDASRLPEGIVETREEGAPGFFWRGTEKIAKLGANVSERLIYDKARFEADKARVVMYLMDHGFYAVTEFLLQATENRTVSTLHETYFMNDTLPGSFQTTSTGAGHFQGTKVDLKRVTGGSGIQFNVLFGAGGAIEKIVGQELKPGDWALALPGHVDYVVNFGGLRFSDLSIELSAVEAAGFSPSFDFSGANLSGVKDAVEQKGKLAPYAALKLGRDVYLMKTREDAPDVRWMPALKNFSGSTAFSDVYSGLSTQNIKDFIEELQTGYSDTLVLPRPNVTVKLLDEKTLADAKTAFRRQ